MDKDKEKAIDQGVFDAIDKYGWHTFTVAPRAESDEQGPVFCYSQGFQKTLGQPEIIVIGLRSNVMHHMIGETFEALKAGRQVEDGAKWTEPLEGYTCETRKVHPSNIVRDWFAYGLWYWRTHLGRTEPYEVHQLFWPGVEDHLLPFEDGAHESVVTAQPRLDLPS